MANNSKTIRLGVCMAGAVSAGAYTAGVVDYLIETLERWERKKAAIREKKEQGLELTPEEELVPLHDVVIEVLSGSSAGGMTAAVLSYSLNDDSYLTKRNGDIPENNYDIPAETDNPTKLYNAWINMVDEDQSTTFKKLMDPEDVVSFSKMRSLLNSRPIDDIAAKAIPAQINFQPPPYISKQLSVVLSVTNMEGIPVDVSFTNVNDTNPTRNVLTTHSGFLHYKFNKEDKIDFNYPPMIISEENRGRLARAAKATGAFPIGLASRKIEIEGSHFQKFKDSMKARNLKVGLELPKNENYNFTAVDGGALNNEPIGTTFRLLNQKQEAYHPEDENYVILIDPFPTVTTATEIKEYEHPSEDGYSLKDQVFKLIKVFRNESSFRQEDLHVSREGRQRYLVSPAKKGFYFLACGLINGFGGFMKKAFRQHDYQLGRKNCQAFLRYYFGESPKKYTKRTGIELTDDQIRRWQYDENYHKRHEEDHKAKFKVPLIPDMIMLKKLELDKNVEANEQTKIELKRVRTEIAEPVYDGLSTDELEEINQSIKQRIVRIVDESYSDIKQAASGLNKWLGRGMKWFPGFFKKKIVHATTGKIDPYLKTTFSAQSVKQAELVEDFIQHLEKGGKYYKSVEIEAIVAKGGECVVSFIEKVNGAEERDKDQVTAREDWNIAKKGDYIVTNGSRRREQYIVPADTFNNKYELAGDKKYRPNENARVYALQISAENIRKYKMSAYDKLISNPMNPIYIEPKWEQSQSLYLDDYLVTPMAKDEVYCIKKEDFEDTYKELTGQ